MASLRSRPLVAALIVLACLIVAGAGAAVATAEPAPQAKWTVMVYMGGDNNLEKWVSHDIDREMAVTGSNADVQVVALADRGPGHSTADGDWTGTLLFNVAAGMKATPDQAVADWGERDMGSPQTLIDFVTWTRANYPGRPLRPVLLGPRLGLVAGQHDGRRDQQRLPRHGRAARCPGGRGRGQHGRHGHVPGADDRGTGRVPRLRQRDRRVRGRDRIHGLRLRPRPERPAGRSDRGRPRPREARGGVDESRDTTNGRSPRRRSALDGRWDALASAVSDLGWDLALGLPKYRKAYSEARRHTARLPQTTYPEVRDLYDAAVELRARVPSRTIKKDCTRVIVALRRAVRYEWHTTAEGDLHGVSFFWPASPAPPGAGSSFSQWVNFQYYCTQLTFTRLTYWGDFLAAWGG